MINNSNSQSNNTISIFEDTVSKIKFFPSSQFNILATSDWDSKINVFNVNYNRINNDNNIYDIQHIYSQQFRFPLLTLTWFPDSYNIITSDIEGVIYNLNIETNQIVPLGKHTLGCNELLMFNINNNNILISGGWDGYLHFWDFRCPSPILSINQGKKIYCMDRGNSLLYIAYDKRILQYYNLSKFGHGKFTHELEFESNMNLNTKSICAFSNDDGFAFGSIGGKVTIKNSRDIKINDKNVLLLNQNDFSFKAHRNNNNNYVYSINCMSYNKIYKTFATGGSDCRLCLWDVENRKDLSSYEHNSQINSIDFSYNGDLLAYSCGYDWSEGINGKIETVPNVGIHCLKQNEKVHRIN